MISRDRDTMLKPPRRLDGRVRRTDPAAPLHRRVATAVVLSFSLAALCGCQNIQASKLLAPTTFGMEPIAPNLYVEKIADQATRTRLSEAIDTAEIAMRAAYGDIRSRPTVNACVSEACYASFGGAGSIAKVYGSRILLSPRGLDWHFLAHEWSHAEIRSRLTLVAWWRLPQWFDEGIAVAVSEAPEHSEAHWQFLVDANIPRPSVSELHSLNTLNQWLAAVERYGETGNATRKAKGEPEIRPVYTAAGHELRPWLAQSGQCRLLDFIERMNRGEPFDEAYHAATQTLPSK